MFDSDFLRPAFPAGRFLYSLSNIKKKIHQPSEYAIINIMISVAKKPFYSLKEEKRETMLQMPGYTAPDVPGESASAGFLPLNFYAATIFPAYFKLDGNLPPPGVAS